MTVEERKKIVASILEKAKGNASKEAEIIKNEPSPNKDFVKQHLKKFIAYKYMLDPETDMEEDNIRKLALMSLEKTMKLYKDMIKQLDQATPCDHATSESAKKVLLLFAVQKELGIKPDPAELAATESVDKLAELVTRHLKKSE